MLHYVLDAQVHDGARALVHEGAQCAHQVHDAARGRWRPRTWTARWTASQDPRRDRDLARRTWPGYTTSYS